LFEGNQEALEHAGEFGGQAQDINATTTTEPNSDARQTETMPENTLENDGLTINEQAPNIFKPRGFGDGDLIHPDREWSTIQIDDVIDSLMTKFGNIDNGCRVMDGTNENQGTEVLNISMGSFVVGDNGSTADVKGRITEVRLPKFCQDTAWNDGTPRWILTPLHSPERWHYFELAVLTQRRGNTTVLMCFELDPWSGSNNEIAEAWFEQVSALTGIQERVSVAIDGLPQQPKTSVLCGAYTASFREYVLTNLVIGSSGDWNEYCKAKDIRTTEGASGEVLTLHVAHEHSDLIEAMVAKIGRTRQVNALCSLFARIPTRAYLPLI
jgi:hypothetical protein